MYHKHHTKGIIISSKSESSDSKRIDLFTESFGLLSVRVQGARNNHSKLRAGAQDFSFGDFSLIHGKTGWRVASIRPTKNFFEVFRGSDDKLKVAGNVLNLVKKLSDEETAHSSLFLVVYNFLNFLTKAKEGEIALAECLTLMRVLHYLGYMRHDPELSVPVSSSEITIESLEQIAPRRFKMVQLINESLKAT